jgi:hypothetical protein
MSDETKQGMKETVATADEANDAVKKLQNVVESAVHEGEENVEKVAAEVEQVSSEALVATDEVTL